MSKRRSNKSVKRMICGILENKPANCEVKVRFIDSRITVLINGRGLNFTQGVSSFDANMSPRSNNKPSIIVSAVGSTIISISSAIPAKFDQSGYEELEFTEIGAASELKGE